MYENYQLHFAYKAVPLRGSKCVLAFLGAVAEHFVCSEPDQVLTPLHLLQSDNVPLLLEAYFSTCKMGMIKPTLHVCCQNQMRDRKNRSITRNNSSLILPDLNDTRHSCDDINISSKLSGGA